MKLIAQPQATVAAELATLLSGVVTNVDIAAAYATFSGVKELRRQMPANGLPGIAKRFLIGVDWFRSEPSALDSLKKIPDAQVRIVDGNFLIENGCRPRRTYHPKAYLVGGPSSRLIVGSANLSRNGLSRSVELSLVATNQRELADFSTWFNGAWGVATPWGTIRTRYTNLYEPAKMHEHVLTEDDEIEDERVLRIRWVTADRLRIIRAAQHLWTDVGNLHNRDPQGLRGTDLQFTQMTRVFFGYPARIVAGNTPLGDIRLKMDGAQPQARPMVFNKSSSMDRLSLPVPNEGGWPPSYDGETLLFSKSADGSYDVEVATAGARAAWRRRSVSRGFVVPMQLGLREWGVF